MRFRYLVETFPECYKLFGTDAAFMRQLQWKGAHGIGEVGSGKRIEWSKDDVRAAVARRLLLNAGISLHDDGSARGDIYKAIRAANWSSTYRVLVIHTDKVRVYVDVPPEIWHEIGRPVERDDLFVSQLDHLLAT